MSHQYFGKYSRVLICFAALILGVTFLAVFWRSYGFDQYFLSIFIDSNFFVGEFGMALFICIYVIFTVLLFPTLLMNVLAGFIWGGVIGGLVSCVAVTMGSWISFHLSRSVLRKQVDAMSKPHWFERAEREINQNDWRYLIFIRMNPIFPTGPINYLLGLTKIENFIYLSCTFLPLLVPSVVIAFAGSLLSEFAYADVSELNFSFVMILMGAVSLLFLFLVNLKTIRKRFARRN